MEDCTREFYISEIEKNALTFESIMMYLGGRKDPIAEDLMIELFKKDGLKQEKLHLSDVVCTQIIDNPYLSIEIKLSVIKALSGLGVTLNREGESFYRDFSEFAFHSREIVDDSVESKWIKYMELAFSLDNKPEHLLLIGIHFYEKKAYKAAIEYFGRATLKNCVESIYFISYMHAKGLGVEKDLYIAAKWNIALLHKSLTITKWHYFSAMGFQNGATWFDPDRFGQQFIQCTSKQRLLLAVEMNRMLGD